MEFKIKMYGKIYTYNRTLEELISDYASTKAGEYYLLWEDGFSEEISIDDFVEDVYSRIVSQRTVEIRFDDGMSIDYRFPDSVKFMTTERIKNIIRGTYPF